MPWSHLRRLAALSLALLLVACTSAAPPTTPVPIALTIFAASSLNEAMTAVEAGFRAATPGTPPAQFNFAGSQALLAQLKQGASADLFVTADAPTMDAARTAGLVLSPQVLARNSLVVVLPSSNPGGVRTLADLARPGLKIVLAAPAVPVGSYTLQVLDKLAADAAYGPGFKAGVLANVVSQEENVRRVLTKVQLGEADAGIVYRTDARAPTAAGGTQTITILDIPPAANVTAVYYIAVLKGAVALQAASAFQTYALGPDGQAALGRFGFLPAGPTPTP